MEVRKGYKKTGVGVIPEDWEVKRFGDVLERIIGGGTPSRSKPDYWGQEIPWVTVKDFSTFNPNTTQEYITKLGLRNSSSNLIPKGTVITSTRMALGKAVIYDIDVSINQDLKALFSGKNVKSNFIYYWFQLNSNKISELGSGSTVMGISLPDLIKIPFLKPTLEEQIAIATALSDADALIQSLEKLIAKKRSIKQGAMKELLTGKKRLKGFGSNTKRFKQTAMGLIPEEWQIFKVKDIATITTGSRNTQDRVDSGEYPFFVRSQTVERINTYSFDGEAVLTAGDGVGTGKVFHYINGKFDFHQRVYKISNFRDGINGYFFFLFFSNNFYNRIIQMTAKSSVDSVRMEMVADMQIPIPPTVEEQTFIATTLSDMAVEITSLETKLSKYKQIKQGMMQNLLTGRVRLI